MTDIEFRIPAQYTNSIHVSGYQDNEVWLSLQVRGGSAYTVLSRDQAKELIAALTKVIEA